MATNAPNMVSFGGNIAQTMIAPDLAAEQLRLQRQQQVADFLRQQALAPTDQQTVTGSGPTRVVPNSPMAGIAKLLQAYVGGKSQDKIDERNLGISRELAARYATALRGDDSPTVPQAQPAHVDPATQPQPAPVAASPQVSNDAGAGSDAGSAPSAAPDAPPMPPPQVAQNAPAPMPPQGAPHAAPVGGPAMPGGANNFGLAQLLRGSMIEQVGGAPAAAAYWDQSKLPDAVKVNNYYGMPKGDVAAGMARTIAAQGQTLVRNASTLGRTNQDGSFTPLFTAPDTKDNANITWQGGKPVAEPIQGLTAGVQAITRAREAGAGEVLPYAGVDAQGNPLPVTSRTAAATQGQPNAAAPGVAVPQGQPGAAPGITNPGNLRPQGASTGFQNFATPEEGLAALDKNLASYGKQGVNTVSAIVSKWAPPNENNTASYIADVSKRLGVDPSQPLDMANPIVRQALSTAITLHEHGPAKVFTAPQGAPAGAIYAAPPLGTPANADAAQKASAQSMHASYSRLQATNSSAQAALDALDKMLGLAANKNAILTAGPLGTNQAAINPDAAEYEKQRANLITQLAQQNGTNATDAGRALTAESVPDFGKPKSAIADGLGTLRNQTVVQQLKANFLTPVYQQGDSKKYTTLENDFDQHISPSLVPLLTMPPGPQRAAQLQAAGKNPALRAKLNWAAENGLLK